jgi:hypothetical protein
VRIAPIARAASAGVAPLRSWRPESAPLAIKSSHSSTRSNIAAKKSAVRPSGSAPFPLAPPRGDLPARRKPREAAIAMLRRDEMSLDPSSLFASMMVGLVGTALFIYGKKQVRAPQMIAGLAMMIYPWFVPDPLWMSLIGAALLALVWGAGKVGF